ncbi:hypothetical protein ES703_10436 [subsurface metagenome]
MSKEFPPEETIWYCPKCSRKLYKPHGIIIPSLPPQVDVRCLNCNYKGYRFLYPIKYKEYEIKLSEEDYIKKLRELIEKYGNDSEVIDDEYINLLKEIIKKELGFKRFFDVSKREYKDVIC